MPHLGRRRLIDTRDHQDYIRLSSLELVASEIYDNKIEGSVAELGVYKGDFAKYINEIFYDRKLYLFDTFDGFDTRDINVDTKNNFSVSETDHFADTTVKIVLSKMKHPENCVIKRGYFPQTAEDIKENENFAFVSIDADLYSPIYNGLQFFYPRLARGGYIFVHDYNNLYYRGAKEAVKQFCSENSINYLPLSDKSGTCVVMK